MQWEGKRRCRDYWRQAERERNSGKKRQKEGGREGELVIRFNYLCCRKYTILITNVLIYIGVGLESLAVHPTMFIAGRFIVGVQAGKRERGRKWGGEILFDMVTVDLHSIVSCDHYHNNLLWICACTLYNQLLEAVAVYFSNSHSCRYKQWHHINVHHRGSSH